MWESAAIVLLAAGVLLWLDSLRARMSAAEFDAALGEAIDAIHCASTQKMAA